MPTPRRGTAAAPQWAVAAPLLFLTLALSACPLALAQAPAPPSTSPGEGMYLIDFGFDGETFKQVDYLQQARFPFSLVDYSRDGFDQKPLPSTVGAYGPLAHTTILTAEIVENDTKGWFVTLSNDFFVTYGGGSGNGTLIVTAGAATSPNFATVRVTATTQLPNGTTSVDSDEVKVQLKPYWYGFVEVLRVSTQARQDTPVQIPMRIHNRATYIDSFILNVSAPEGYVVSFPSRVAIPADSFVDVNVTVLTPKRAPYVFQEIAPITVGAASVNEPEAFYKASAVITVRGAYVAGQWVPIAGMLALSMVLLGNRWLDRQEARRLERGYPRRPKPTPRQSVMLADLKKRDPAAYKQKVAQLAAIYKARRKTYRELVREQRKKDREARAAVKRELDEEKARRKEAARLEAQREKEQAAREKALNKERAKRMHALGKERKRLEKVRAKAAKKQAKVDAKEAKKRAKLDAIEAKQRANAEKLAAKEAKKAEKAAKKQAKSQKK